MSLFNIHEDHIKKALSLDKRFIKNKNSTYFFQIESNAMHPTLFKSDYLIVDRSLDPTNGTCVLVSYNRELICRRYQTSGSKVLLTSDNNIHKDIIVKSEDSLIFFGVVTASFRENP